MTAWDEAVGGHWNFGGILPVRSRLEFILAVFLLAAAGIFLGPLIVAMEFRGIGPRLRRLFAGASA